MGLERRANTARLPTLFGERTCGDRLRFGTTSKPASMRAFTMNNVAGYPERQSSTEKKRVRQSKNRRAYCAVDMHLLEASVVHLDIDELRRENYGNAGGGGENFAQWVTCGSC
jgi:hypothetical protein